MQDNTKVWQWLLAANLLKLPKIRQNIVLQGYKERHGQEYVDAVLQNMQELIRIYNTEV